MEITIKENQTIIKDVRNNITYTIPHYEEKYPEYKKLIPDIDKNEDYTKIGVNMANLAKLAALTSRGVPAIMAVNKNPNAAIVVKAEYNGIKSTSLVMPCAIRG